AVDARVRLLRAEHADRVAPRRGVVRVRSDHERASAGPEAREVVLVHELDAAIERSGDDDERDTDEESDEEREVRAALSSHAPPSLLARAVALLLHRVIHLVRCGTRFLRGLARRLRGLGSARILRRRGLQRRVCGRLTLGARYACCRAQRLY